MTLLESPLHHLWWVTNISCLYHRSADHPTQSYQILPSPLPYAHLHRSPATPTSCLQDLHLIWYSFLKAIGVGRQSASFSTLETESPGFVYAAFNTTIKATKGPKSIFPRLKATMEGISCIIGIINVRVLGSTASYIWGLTWCCERDSLPGPDAQTPGHPVYCVALPGHFQWPLETCRRYISVRGCILPKGLWGSGVQWLPREITITNHQVKRLENDSFFYMCGRGY